MGKRKTIPRPPFYANEYLDMAESLEYSMGLFGQLIFALMDYIVNGNVPDDLPSEVKPLFIVNRKKLDFAINSYKETCKTNQKNGKNGGRPRKQAAATSEGEASEPTKPARKAKAAPRIKIPPTEEQLTKLIEQEQADGLISDECDPAEFFEWAEALKWKVNGEPAKNVGDFLRYAEARYPTETVTDSIGIMPQAPRLDHTYGIIFKKLHGLRDDDGTTGALTAAIDFLKAYNGGWNFSGQAFSDDQWQEALNRFMQTLKTQ